MYDKNAIYNREMTASMAGYSGFAGRAGLSYWGTRLG
jgi:hypothetical protein